jgi:hypothetical protein
VFEDEAELNGLLHCPWDGAPMSIFVPHDAGATFALGDLISEVTVWNCSGELSHMWASMAPPVKR